MKSKTTPKYRKHLPLFKKLLHCNECGGTITWSIQKEHWYGYCNRYRKCSQKKYIRQERIEEQVSKGFENLQIKNQRLADWIKRTLQESHKDEIAYHSSVLNELKQRYEQTQKRLDRLYDDKLDEKITKEFYERKFKQYSEKKEAITLSIEKHSQASNKYFELGINIYELSQKAKQIFQKANLEEKGS